MSRALPIFFIVSLLLAAQLRYSAAPGTAKVENPWKALPVGTVLEFSVATDESVSLHPGTKHTEKKEVWTVVANNGKVATIEVATGDAKKFVERDLSPVDPLPEPPPAEGATSRPTAMGAPDGQDRTMAAYDQINTPFGTFKGVRIDHRMVMLEAESQGSEWRVEGIPEPLKVESIHSGGAGVVRTVREIRTLTRFDVPGSTWRDCGVSTSFDVRVEHEHRNLFPPGQRPTVDTSVEHWTLIKKNDAEGVFEVVTGDAKVEKSLPLALDPLPAGDTAGNDLGERVTTQVSRELITTPLGSYYCTRIRRLRSMNEAGGEELEWRVAGFPIAVKTQNRWGHKQQEDTDTRTVVRFERAK